MIELAEDSIKVGSIIHGQELFCLEPGTLAKSAYEQLTKRDFDAAPLLDEPLSRFVERATLVDGEGAVDDHAVTIDTKVLVSATLPLTEALELLRSHQTLFVFGQHNVIAILTRSDLQRSAVTLFVFGLITATETAINEVITRTSGDDWIELLTPARKARIEEIYEDRRNHNTEIDQVSCLNLDDRLALIRRLGIWKDLGFSSATRFRNWEEVLKGLRNVLAHGGSVLDVELDPVAALTVIERVRGFADSTWALGMKEPSRS